MAQRRMGVLIKLIAVYWCARTTSRKAVKVGVARVISLKAAPIVSRVVAPDPPSTHTSLMAGLVWSMAWSCPAAISDCTTLIWSSSLGWAMAIPPAACTKAHTALAGIWLCPAGDSPPRCCRMVMMLVVAVSAAKIALKSNDSLLITENPGRIMVRARSSRWSAKRIWSWALRMPAFSSNTSFSRSRWSDSNPLSVPKSVMAIMSNAALAAAWSNSRCSLSSRC